MRLQVFSTLGEAHVSRRGGVIPSLIPKAHDMQNVSAPIQLTSLPGKGGGPLSQLHASEPSGWNIASSFLPIFLLLSLFFSPWVWPSSLPTFLFFFRSSRCLGSFGVGSPGGPVKHDRRQRRDGREFGRWKLAGNGLRAETNPRERARAPFLGGGGL